MLDHLQSRKFPGLDKIPVEFYSFFHELLTPRFTSLFVQFTSLGSLLDSMFEAVIVLCPNQAKTLKIVPLIGQSF